MTTSFQTNPYKLSDLMRECDEGKRLGTRFALTSDTDADVSVFMNNVTNNLPLISLFHETPDSEFYRSGTFRPRTFGLTLTVRN